jgi:hypothetical protein
MKFIRANMKILENKIIARIEYFFPYMPGRGYKTFYGIGSSVEEIISELCQMYKLNSSCIHSRELIAKCDCITTKVVEGFICLYADEYHKRQKKEKHSMDDYLNQNQTKTSISSIKRDTVYSVL